MKTKAERQAIDRDPANKCKADGGCGNTRRVGEDYCGAHMPADPVWSDFDSCPECGAEPTYGIRRHPRFAFTVGIIDGDFSDLVPVYTHTREALFAIYRKMGSPGFTDFQEWNGQEWMRLIPFKSELDGPERQAS